MASTTTRVLVDKVRVVVPDSLRLITPYVLQEQQDWFEDEIKFLRKLLQPGQNVIDIGANYGVYTLSMAQTVGPGGRVWTFEPASNTASLLAEGIAANGFSQVILERSALSSNCGMAQLSINENSELNALVHGASSTSASETVPLVTLDECLIKYGWRDIDFMKIDAEGEEANILKGGKRFFSQLSPLVQYEIRAGTDLHMQLVREFVAIGYDSYRLVPGLDLLAHFSERSTPDGYLLNLFGCKRDRADRLAARGFLANSTTRLPAEKTKLIAGASGNNDDRNAYHWRNTIAKMPYGVRLANHWEETMAAGNSAKLDEALSLYFFSQHSSRLATERFHALEASFTLLKTMCERQPTRLRLASLARVARDFGARSLAVDALDYLSNAISRHKQVDASEPFLAPGRRFDSVPPGKSIANWVLASILEELERLASYSSFYTGVTALQRLKAIRTLGFGSAEMERRLQLLQRRFGLSAS